MHWNSYDYFPTLFQLQLSSLEDERVYSCEQDYSDALKQSHQFLKCLEIIDLYVNFYYILTSLTISTAIYLLF